MIKLTQKYHNEDLFPTKIREWPLYSTQILNICNANAKGTTVKHIGSLKELWVKMKKDGIRSSMKNWFTYLNNNYGPQIVDAATDRIWNMVQKMKQDHIITQDMCCDYAKELIYYKTALGFLLEEQAVIRAAEYMKSTYRLSSKEEESKGIDAWIGDIPVQVKPYDYSSRNRSKVKFDKTKILFIVYSTEKNGVFYIENPSILEDV